jgi:hypothetical protein
MQGQYAGKGSIVLSFKSSPFIVAWLQVNRCDKIVERSKLCITLKAQGTVNKAGHEISDKR